MSIITNTRGPSRFTFWQGFRTKYTVILFLRLCNKFWIFFKENEYAYGAIIHCIILLCQCFNYTSYGFPNCLNYLYFKFPNYLYSQVQSRNLPISSSNKLVIQIAILGYQFVFSHHKHFLQFQLITIYYIWSTKFISSNKRNSQILYA